VILPGFFGGENCSPPPLPARAEKELIVENGIPARGAPGLGFPSNRAKEEEVFSAFSALPDLRGVEVGPLYFFPLLGEGKKSLSLPIHCQMTPPAPVHRERPKPSSLFSPSVESQPFTFFFSQCLAGKGEEEEFFCSSSHGWGSWSASALSPLQQVLPPLFTIRKKWEENNAPPSFFFLSYPR